MISYSRILDLKSLLSQKSHFLFGPRQTGKSYLIDHELNQDALVIDLLDSRVYLQLQTEPWLLESYIDKQKKYVVIDEIQKIPSLLNEVHRLIEKRLVVFLLTGSSARSLRRKGVNLLAGRAWQANLYPLCYKEIPDFNLDRYLTYGGLPGVYKSASPTLELKAYVSTYLSEEIHAESELRKIPAFMRFLQSAAISSGTKLNFTKIARDAGCSPNTIKDYYQILQDSLLGFMLPSYQQLDSRKSVSTAKFYYFDIGVKNNLQLIDQLSSKTSSYGQAFEHFIAQELRAYLGYTQKRQVLSYWQNTKGTEVDFVCGDELAIEVKATTVTSMRDAKGLHACRQEGFSGRLIVVSRDPLTYTQDGILFMAWFTFLDKLWSDQLI